MKSIVLIGKGPSAVHAALWRKPKDDVAVINDGARFVSGDIDYCFFIHDVVPMEPFAHRVDTFVSPVVRIPENHWSAKGNRYITYQHRECGATVDAFRQRIIAGGICHHHTTTAAIHWLAKFGKYDLVRIIGVDGGSSYADGSYVDPYRDVESRLGVGFLDEWKRITVSLSRVLTSVYGTEFDWYDS